MELNRGKWRVRINHSQKAALFETYAQSGGVIAEDRIKVWMNLDKLGVAIYLYWLIHESARSYEDAEAAQHQLDLGNLLDSLERNLL